MCERGGRLASWLTLGVNQSLTGQGVLQGALGWPQQGSPLTQKPPMHQKRTHHGRPNGFVKAGWDLEGVLGLGEPLCGVRKPLILTLPARQGTIRSRF